MREVFENLVTIVGAVGVELGLSLNELNVMTSNDRDTKQVGYLTQATCEDLLTRHPWRNTVGTTPWVLKADGSYTYALAADTDIPQLDARAIKQGAKWRYLQSKGLTYDEVFRAYEKRIYDFAFDYNNNQVVNTNVGAFNAL
jgi:hypothetical protein